MCDAETRKRFANVDIALSSLTNDTNQTAKETFKRLNKLEVNQGVNGQKLAHMSDTIDDMKKLMELHLVDADKDKGRLTVVEQMIASAKGYIAGIASTVSIVWIIVGALFAAAFKYL